MLLLKLMIFYLFFRAQFKVVFTSGQIANNIIVDGIQKNGKLVNGITIVTPSANQNFTEKDELSVKKPKIRSFAQSSTLKQFSENTQDTLKEPKDLNENSHNLSLSPPAQNLENTQDSSRPSSEKLIQIRPITDTYLAPVEQKANNVLYVPALSYTVDYDYSYNYDDDDTIVEPVPEISIGSSIPLSKLVLSSPESVRSEISPEVPHNSNNQNIDHNNEYPGDNGEALAGSNNKVARYYFY